MKILIFKENDYIYGKFPLEIKKVKLDKCRPNPEHENLTRRKYYEVIMTKKSMVTR